MGQPGQIAQHHEEHAAQQIILLGRALSDPIRVRMLLALAREHGPVTAQIRMPEGDRPEGICVSEFMALYEMGQSKISYHIRILKEAGLIAETTRGKWTFYALDRARLASVLVGVEECLLPVQPNPEDSC